MGRFEGARASVARCVARSSAVLALAVALVVVSGGVARADGDPASDYLVASQVFLSSQSTAMSPAQRQLVAAVAAANRAGFAIRVAVISSDYDLGSVPELWDKPRDVRAVPWRGVVARVQAAAVAGRHAEWVWFQLAGSRHRAHLSIARDGATGQPRGGGSGSRRRRLPYAAWHAPRELRFRRASPRRVADRRGRGALRLSRLSAPRQAGSLHYLRSPSSSRERGVGSHCGAKRREVPRSFRLPRELRWAVPGLVVLCGVAVAAPILAAGHSRRSSAPTAYSAVSLVSPPASSWGVGDRRAPDFSLRDQDGRPVSVAANRGHPVIVTFVDPLCRNFCPLEAQVLNQMERQIPAAHRPVILSVSVDVYANARRYLLQDDREWRLVPEWRWAVGHPADLAAVWNSYRIGVKVKTWRINGTVTYRIDHTEAAYVLDASGHERALVRVAVQPAGPRTACFVSWPRERSSHQARLERAGFSMYLSSSVNRTP